MLANCSHTSNNLCTRTGTYIVFGIVQYILASKEFIHVLILWTRNQLLRKQIGKWWKISICVKLLHTGWHSKVTKHSCKHFGMVPFSFIFVNPKMFYVSMNKTANSNILAPVFIVDWRCLVKVGSSQGRTQTQPSGHAFFFLRKELLSTLLMHEYSSLFQILYNYKYENI